MAGRVVLPESKLKARRRKRRAVLLGTLLILFLLVSGGLILLSRAPVLLIRDIAVSGVETLATSTVEGLVRDEIAGYYAFVLPKNNIFLYPRRAAEKKLLDTLPSLLTASVRASSLTHISVAVRERRPGALWCGRQTEDASASAATTSSPTLTANACFLVDETGVVYAQANDEENMYPRLYGALDGEGEMIPVQFFSPEFIRPLLALSRALGEENNVGNAESIVVGETGTTEIHFPDNFVVLFLRGDDAGDVLNRFNAALSSSVLEGRTVADFEYLDLRFGNKLYYKLKQGMDSGTSAGD